MPACFNAAVQNCWAAAAFVTPHTPAAAVPTLLRTNAPTMPTPTHTNQGMPEEAAARSTGGAYG
eukprot:365823-Chlamydomonas_euryale.AAC.8